MSWFSEALEEYYKNHPQEKRAPCASGENRQFEGREMKEAGERTAKLLLVIKAWCDAGHGRRAELARIIGVPRQRVSDWFSLRKLPTLEQGLHVLEIIWELSDEAERLVRASRRKRKSGSKVLPFRL